MVFARIRCRIVGATPGGTYTFTHPYGVDVVQADGLGLVNFTEDVGIVPIGVLPTAFNLALVSLGSGDHARALNCLEQAYAADTQWLGWLRNDRIFDPLRSEPRFVALLKKLRLDK